jgi:hypothetical protein
MIDELGKRLIARFGASGLRRMDPGEDFPLSGEQAALLIEYGVPRQVGPYFSVADGDPQRLGGWAESTGMPLGPRQGAAWLRLGTDRGAEICLDDSGEVRAEFLGLGRPGAVVNDSPAAFLESLLVLDEALSLIAAAKSVPESAEHIRMLIRRLANIEVGPIGYPDSWWSRVTQDIRHTASHDSYGAFEIADEQGEPQTVTGSGALCAHPEERLWSGLAGAGVPAERVLKVHTELEPCFLPGHYCSLWMAEAFPEAGFTHNFDYGDTAAAREEGFMALLRHAATQS